MDVKVYEGTNMKEIVADIRKDFGKDAVILKTLENYRSGQKTLQVTASGGHGLRGASRESSGSAEGIIETFELVKRIEQKLEHALSALANKRDLMVLDGRLDDLRNLFFEYLRHSATLPYGSENEDIAKLLQYLHVMGLDDGVVSKLGHYLEGVPAPEAGIDSSDDYYKTYAMKWMLKRLQVTPLDYEGGSSLYQLFCGAFSSGKTTMVAKLASWLMKASKVKPVIISLDHNRIAASEQLRIYSKLIGVDFYDVSDAKELIKKLGEFENRLVLVDTPGINPKRPEHIDELSLIKKELNHVDVQLCLSLSEKSQQLNNTIKAFSSIGIDGLCFTGMDEVWDYGDIFNLAYKWGLSLTLFGTGCDPTGEMEKATRERVIERIFGIRG